MSEPRTKRKPIADVPESDVWELYKIVGKFRDQIMGGVPAKEDILTQHLARKGATRDQIQRQLAQLKETMSCDHRENEENRQIDASTNIFFSDAHGVYIMNYQIQAALKEALSIQKSITSWRMKVQNGVRVNPDQIYLLRDGAPVKTWDDFVENPVHTTYMGSPMTCIRRTAFIRKPMFQATIRVAKSKEGPIIDEDTLAHLFRQINETGVGAMRHMGFGALDIEWLE